ncbi:L-threonylcarbamoyladenylate synthase [Methyloradius palustris]|uniref:Threonylcarbamoyl-AMP synthase n=1 Tax=Methyloradius palustris TaxID=2778876 RepID=A0A8D5FYH5_9PROT|nr:Sua5/YciO/YrdC/YwlC family protein [Methyloradius palustris]BCM24065.1 threonylcarbamoyl-AMP synthase [Methyloradius palustris]
MTQARGLRSYLRSGGVIAYPTESIFGLGCDPDNRLAVQRILRIKQRPKHKGLILLADRFSAFQRYIAPLTASQIASMQHSWLGKAPHTWLVPAAKDCPKWLSGKHKTIAIRVTQHAFSKRLCKQLGMALVSTSANKSGHQPAKTSRQCYKLFSGQTRILPGMTAGAKKPSTIQDLLTGKILRK